MRTSADIIEALGGLTVVARETDNPLTTVQGWRDANFVPRWHQPSLLAMAKRLNKPLKKADFPPKTHRVSRRQAAQVAA